MKREATIPELKAALAVQNVKAGKTDVSGFYDRFVEEGVDDDDIAYLKSIITRYHKQVLNFREHIENLTVDKKQKISFTHIHMAVANYEKPKNSAEYIERVLFEVCRFFQVSVNEVKGKGRKSTFVKPRHIFWYLTKDNITRKHAGKLLQRDHSSVIHAIESVQNQIETNEIFHDEVETLKRLVF